MLKMAKVLSMHNQKLYQPLNYIVDIRMYLVIALKFQTDDNNLDFSFNCGENYFFETSGNSPLKKQLSTVVM